MCGRFSAALLIALCLGFDWPSRVSHYAYEFRHGSSEDKRGLLIQIAKEPSKEATELLLRALEDVDDNVRLFALNAMGTRHVDAGLAMVRDLARDKSASIRAAAVAALGRSSDQQAALPSAVRALDDADSHVRVSAAHSLARLRQQAAAPALLAKLTDSDPAARLAVVAALGDLGDRAAVAPLTANLREAEPAIQRATANALAQLGDPLAVPSLLQLATASVDEDIRIAALLAIGQIGGPQAEAALIAQLTSAEGRTAMALITALGRIGSDAAMTALLPWLTHATLGPSAAQALVHCAKLGVLAAADPDSPASSPPGAGPVNSLVARVMKILSNIQIDADAHASLAAISELLVRLAEYEPIDAASDLLVQRFTESQSPMLVEPLAATNSEPALIALLGTLSSDEPTLRRAALLALRDFQVVGPYDSRAADPLLEALPHAQPEELPIFAGLLGKTKAPRVAPALVTMLSRPDWATKLAAIDALANVRSPEAVAALTPLLSSSTPDTLRWHAAVALGSSVDEGQREQLVSLLKDAKFDQTSLLHALALSLSQSSEALNETTAASLLEQLKGIVAGAHEDAAIAAIELLAIYRPKNAIDLLGRILREPSDSRRQAAAAALGQFKAGVARPLLRYLLLHASPEVALGSLQSLASVGDQRDLAAVMKLAARSHYPLPNVVPYVLSRWLDRKVVASRTAQRALCSLIDRPEPLLRANVVAALAKAAAGDCESQGVRAIDFLQTNRTQPERLAGAHWLMAMLRNQPEDPEEFQTVRKNCALFDPDPWVRRVCLGKPLDVLHPLVHVRNLGFDHAPLRSYLVATQHRDGTVRVTRTSPHGFVEFLGEQSGVLRVIDPGLFAIEVAAEDDSEDSIAVQ